MPEIYGDSEFQNIPFVGDNQQVNYMIWRDPISPSLSGSTVSLQLHPYFYLSIGDAYDPFAQCGFRHETAQERLIGVTSTLSWSPQWAVNAATMWSFLTVTPTPQPPMIDCKLSVAQYDATGKINSFLTDQLNKLRDRLDQDIADETNIHSEATALWSMLAATTDVGSDTYLQIHPYAANVGPIGSSATAMPEIFKVTSTVELLGSPQLYYGSAPMPDVTPLPPLGTSPTAQDGFELNVDLNYPIADAVTVIAAKFPYVLNYGKHQLVLCNPVLIPDGSRLALQVDFFSQVNIDTTPPKGLWGHIKSFLASIPEAIDDYLWSSTAKIYLEGTPAFDVPRRDVWVPDLDFTVESKSILIKALDFVFHTLLIPDVRELTRYNLGDRVDAVYPQLNAALNRTMGKGELTGYTNLVAPDQVFLTPDAIIARFRASGSLAYKVESKIP